MKNLEYLSQKIFKVNTNILMIKDYLMSKKTSISTNPNCLNSMLKSHEGSNFFSGVPFGSKTSNCFKFPQFKHSSPCLQAEIIEWNPFFVPSLRSGMDEISWLVEKTISFISEECT